MTPALICAIIWLVVANVMAMIPSRDNLWQRAYFLMALGLPLLIWLFYQNGIFVGLLFLAGAISVLRWPMIYLARWLRGQGTDDA